MKNTLFWVIVVVLLLGLHQTQAREMEFLDLPISNAIKYEFTDSALNITYTFDTNVSEFDQSTITYGKIKAGVKLPTEPPKPFDTRDANNFIFSIPSTYFADAESIEFSMTLKKAGETAVNLTKSAVDVSGQNRLRKILANQPTTVFYRSTLVTADNSIGISFGTDNAGKIKVTIVGTNAPQPQISQKVDTTHDFLFTNLVPNTLYTFKAEALQMDEDNKILTSVQPVDTIRLGLTLRTTNVGIPTVQVAPLQLSPTNIVIPVRSNQEAFAEVVYTPIDPSTNAPVYSESKSLTTINCSAFNKCSGTEKINGRGDLQSITIPNLKPGTSYKIALTFKNEIGYKAALLNNGEYFPSLPPVTNVTNFNFAEEIPIEAKITPFGIDVTWTATDIPTSATAKYIRDDGSKTILTEAINTDFRSKNISAHFDTLDVIKLISFQKTAILEVTMVKDGKPLSRRIKFSYALPATLKELADTQAAQPTTQKLPQDTYDSIKKLIDSKTGNSSKGFKWTDLLKTGVSIFLAL